MLRMYRGYTDATPQFKRERSTGETVYQYELYEPLPEFLTMSLFNLENINFESIDQVVDTAITKVVNDKLKPSTEEEKALVAAIVDDVTDIAANVAKLWLARRGSKSASQTAVATPVTSTVVGS